MINVAGPEKPTFRGGRSDRNAGLSAFQDDFVTPVRALACGDRSKGQDCQQVAVLLHSSAFGSGHALARIYGTAAMLNRCANPGCGRRFRKLEEGKLFLVEIGVAEASPSARWTGDSRLFRNLEHYWLCDSCASVLTLSFDHERGVVAVPLTRATEKKPAASERSGGAAATPSRRICEPIQSARGASNEA
jgi:hypothetical protein